MDLLETIQKAGIVGCGGAGFPTHVKLKGNFEYFIINGAECEPLLRNDRYLMREKAKELIFAADKVGKELNIPNVVFALKEHYEDEIAALKNAIRESGARVKLCLLQGFYPAGDEQTIAYEVTGKVVPPAGLPSEVGAVIDNVATLYAMYLAMEKGYPLTMKYMTISGEVNNPCILCVPVGTSFKECIEQAGGAKHDEYGVLSGGPMMGKYSTKEEAEKLFVTKTTSGILVVNPDGYHANASLLNVKRMLNRAKSACIQCTNCTQLCPRYNLGHPLRPHMVMRKLAAGNIADLLDDQDIKNAQLCCECGICEVFACPMGLNPRKINSMVKGELAKAGIKYERKQSSWEPTIQRDDRLIPQQKIADRLGLGGFNRISIEDFVKYEPNQVSIALKMHIGVPSEPVVKMGDRVEKGDLIAKAPEGKLGACIHASISGIVTEVTDKITIKKG